MTTTLITGANKGLGLETARQLLVAGHTVYVGSRDVERGRLAVERLTASAAAELSGPSGGESGGEPGTRPGTARAIRLDVTDDGSVADAAETIAAAGGLDVLVNNAGIQAEMGPGGVADVIGAAELTVEMLRTTFETNLFGTVRVLQAFVPLLLGSSAPVVVNVSSGLASFGRITVPDSRQYAYPGIAYPASKAALNLVTVQYAKAYPGIRINAVEPGFTATDLNAGTGRQTVEQGAAVIVAMARIGRDGPTGTLVDAEGPMPW